METQSDMEQYANWKAPKGSDQPTEVNDEMTEVIRGGLSGGEETVVSRSPGGEITQVSTKRPGVETRASLDEGPDVTKIEIEVPSVIDEVALMRQERKLMPHQDWVERITNALDTEPSIPEGYIFQSELYQELEAVPEEWKQVSRMEDRPPPPVFDHTKSFDPINIPDHVYAAGVKWEVGNRVGKGAFGSVYEVSYGGSESQKKRLVKFVAAKGGNRRIEMDNGEVGDYSLYMMWNEVGGMMAAGDLLCTEMIQEPDGDTMIAIVMDQYKGEDMFDAREKRMRSEEEMVSSPEWGYQMAVALRSVVSTLRKMHSLGWTHRDVKPGNVMLPEDVDEAGLAHLIDHGIAKGGGVVRTSFDEPIAGSPSYMLPESLMRHDDDLRLRDYWAAMITTTRTLGLVRFNTSKKPHEIASELAAGEYIKSADLFQVDKREAYFAYNKIEGAQREFVQWLYDFLQPHMDIANRHTVWRKKGLIEGRKVKHKVEEMGRFVEKETYGDFFNDDKFVGELEGHIQALAEQAGVEMPEDMIERFQEF